MTKTAVAFLTGRSFSTLPGDQSFSASKSLPDLRQDFLCFSNMPAAHRVKLLHSLDADGDGKIDLEEFRQLFKK